MIAFRNVSFQYGEKTEERKEVNGGGVFQLNLTIKKGECVLLTGSSGCGKTTVTRMINGLIPNYYTGELSGSILVDGMEVNKLPISETAKIVGSVFQNPRSQFFNVDTTSELAFALENQGMPVDEIEQRVNRTVKQFAIDSLMNRSLFQLSGGEKQKIACASIAVAEPEIIVLDEPSSNLDVYAIEELKLVLKRWKEQGKTIVIAEHRLYFLRELANRMLIMENGRIKKEIRSEEIRNMKREDTSRLGLRSFQMKELHFQRNARRKSAAEMKIDAFQYYYADKEHGIHVDNLSVAEGAVVAVIGHNGAGKSTFARCLCGLEKKCKGCISIGGREYKPRDGVHTCYLVMQDVNHQLFTESVLDEVVLGMEDMTGNGEEQQVCAATEILSKVDLEKHLKKHPMALSGGQKQRVAIASAIATERKVIIFDEPTSGLDYLHMNQVAELLKKLSASNRTIFVITHDLEFIMNCCTDVLHLEDGKLEAYYELNEENKERLHQFFSM